MVECKYLLKSKKSVISNNWSFKKLKGAYMEYKNGIYLKGFSLFILLCMFTFFASKTSFSFIFILAISIFLFFAFVFPYFILMINEIGNNSVCQFIDLNQDREYKVIKKGKGKTKIELKNGEITFVKDFQKYAPFVNEGDYFIIKSFSPLDIEWVVRENASENINFYS